MVPLRVNYQIKPNFKTCVLEVLLANENNKINLFLVLLIKINLNLNQGE